MGIFEIIVLSIGLAMDAFAVSICKGLSAKEFKIKHALTAGLWFGCFQAIMPLIGYFVGLSFASYIESFDHWIAFALLLFIGGKMIKESFAKAEDNHECCFQAKAMFPLAIATSIDALAVGITFAFLKVNVAFSVASIGIITFLFAFLGIKLGSVVGNKYQSKAELFGGIVLVLIGLKILLEHLFF